MILVDTHVVLWLAFEETRLSQTAHAAVTDARQRKDGMGICDVTLLELTMLARKRRIGLEISMESFLAEVESRFVVFPITARACARALGLPASFPKDPADRIIAATALVEGLPLLTADREIRRSRAVPTIW